MRTSESFPDLMVVQLVEGNQHLELASLRMDAHSHSEGADEIIVVEYAVARIGGVEVLSFSGALEQKDVIREGSRYEYGLYPTKQFTCPYFSVGNTGTASYNTSNCDIEVCPGEIISATVCDAYSGDTFFSLYGPNGEALEHDDDSCGLGSTIHYFDHEYYYDECKTYSLRQGCYGDDYCSGSTTVYYEQFMGHEIIYSEHVFPSRVTLSDFHVTVAETTIMGSMSAGIDGFSASLFNDGKYWLVAVGEAEASVYTQDGTWLAEYGPTSVSVTSDGVPKLIITKESDGFYVLIDGLDFGEVGFTRTHLSGVSWANSLSDGVSAGLWLENDKTEWVRSVITARGEISSLSEWRLTFEDFMIRVADTEVLALTGYGELSNSTFTLHDVVVSSFGAHAVVELSVYESGFDAIIGSGTKSVAITGDGSEAAIVSSKGTWVATYGGDEVVIKSNGETRVLIMLNDEGFELNVYSLNFGELGMTETSYQGSLFVKKHGETGISVGLFMRNHGDQWIKAIFTGSGKHWDNENWNFDVEESYLVIAGEKLFSFHGKGEAERPWKVTTSHVLSMYFDFDIYGSGIDPYRAYEYRQWMENEIYAMTGLPGFYCYVSTYDSDYGYTYGYCNLYYLLLEGHGLPVYSQEYYQNLIDGNSLTTAFTGTFGSNTTTYSRYWYDNAYLYQEQEIEVGAQSLYLEHMHFEVFDWYLVFDFFVKGFEHFVAFDTGVNSESLVQGHSFIESEASFLSFGMGLVVSKFELFNVLFTAYGDVDDPVNFDIDIHDALVRIAEKDLFDMSITLTLRTAVGLEFALGNLHLFLAGNKVIKTSDYWDVDLGKSNGFVHTSYGTWLAWYDNHQIVVSSEGVTRVEIYNLHNGYEARMHALDLSEIGFYPTSVTSHIVAMKRDPGVRIIFKFRNGGETWADLAFIGDGDFESPQSWRFDVEKSHIRFVGIELLEWSGKAEMVMPFEYVEYNAVSMGISFAIYGSNFSWYDGQEYADYAREAIMQTSGLPVGYCDAYVQFSYISVSCSSFFYPSEWGYPIEPAEYYTSMINASHVLSHFSDSVEAHDARSFVYRPYFDFYVYGEAYNYFDRYSLPGHLSVKNLDVAVLGYKMSLNMFGNETVVHGVLRTSRGDIGFNADSLEVDLELSEDDRLEVDMMFSSTQRDTMVKMNSSIWAADVLDWDVVFHGLTMRWYGDNVVTDMCGSMYINDNVRYVYISPIYLLFFFA